MTSDQLQIFLITAKHLNFSAAAKELYVSQPAVSHQISMLEKELGVRLFTRSTRKIQLSRSGELFLEDAKRILDIMESSRERVSLADTEHELSLSICYLLAPSQEFLPKVCNRMIKQYPQVRLKLNRMVAHEIDDAMNTKEHDIFFSLSRDLAHHADYAQKDLISDRLYLICSAEHPWVNPTSIDYNKLASEQFLMMDPEAAPLMYKQIMQLCRSIDFQPLRTRFCHSLDEVLFEVEAGLGITILPRKGHQMLSDSLMYIPLPGRLSHMNMGVAWRMNSDNPTVGWFLDLLDRFRETHPELF